MVRRSIFERTGHVVQHSRTSFVRPVCWCITLVAAFGGALRAQQVTTKAPSARASASPVATVSAPLDQTSPAEPLDLPTAPSAERFPYAVPVPLPGNRKVILESERQTRNGDKVLLDGDVHVRYGDYRVEADHIEYNDATGDVAASGHVYISGGANSETISASRGNLNIRDETGRFYDVHGSIGRRRQNMLCRDLGLQPG